MRVAEYIAQALADAGITDVFSVTGGACMFLTDAIAKHPDLRVTYCAESEPSCANG
jgi:acetolactate synthase-1/2/3 large subunit